MKQKVAIYIVKVIAIKAWIFKYRSLDKNALIIQFNFNRYS